MMYDYDVAIIGLGPAGSTFARHLPKNVKAIAIDKKNPHNLVSGFHKPCGGLLAPDSQRFLSRFDLALPKSVLADPQIFSVKTMDFNTGLIRDYPRFYMNMNRHKFDLWLMSLIPKNVTVYTKSRCTELTRVGDGWVVDFVDDGKPKAVKVRYIVGADGANSFIRRAVNPDFKIRSYTAIQQGFEAKSNKLFNSKNTFLCVFDSKITDCYAWGLNKDGIFVFGGAFEKQNCKKRFDMLKARATELGFDLKNPLFTESCMVNRPANLFQFCPVSKGAIFIGEAAGFISPSSLEGISYAMESGYLLSQAFTTKTPIRSYYESSAKIERKLKLKQMKCPFLYSTILRSIILKTGIMSINKEN